MIAPSPLLPSLLGLVGAKVMRVYLRGTLLEVLGDQPVRSLGSISRLEKGENGFVIPGETGIGVVIVKKAISAV